MACQMELVYATAPSRAYLQLASVTWFAVSLLRERDVAHSLVVRVSLKIGKVRDVIEVLDLVPSH